MKISSYKVLILKKGLSETCYRFFSILGNPTRLAALESLIEGPMNVSQLAKVLGQEQSMISHNLKPLVKCRFVEVERRGKERIYSVNSDTISPLFEVVEYHARNYCPMKGYCLEIEK
jgi:DNA-binding transcriptional ArsR family regulator